MQVVRAVGFLTLPLLVTCGAPGHGTVLLDREAREAGAQVDILDAKGVPHPFDVRALPFRLEPGESAAVRLGGHEISVEASPGTTLHLTGRELRVETVAPPALEVTGSEAAVRRLANFVGAQMQEKSRGVFVLFDGGSDLIERAAEAPNDSEITDVKPFTPEVLPAIVLPQPVVAAAPKPAEVKPSSQTASPPDFGTPVPTTIDPSRRYVQFFGHCGSWIPAANEPFEAHFADGSVAQGVTDALGLVVLDDAPSLDAQVSFAHGNGRMPRPYELRADDHRTIGNVTTSLGADNDIDRLAWALLDAGRLARPEWAGMITERLSHPHQGIRVLAAAALLRYPAEIQEHALTTVMNARWRNDAAYVLGRVSSRVAPTPIWSSGGTP